MIAIVLVTGRAVADDCIDDGKYEQQRDAAVKRSREAKDKVLGAKKLASLAVKPELDRVTRHDRATTFDKDGKTYVAGPVELVRMGKSNDVYGVVWSGKLDETRVTVCGCRPPSCELSGQNVYELPKGTTYKGELALEVESWVVWPFYLGGASCKAQDCPAPK